MEANSNERDLLRIAWLYREAIEQAVQAKALGPLWYGFPKGCCNGACNLLQRFFFENGIETLIIYGRFNNSKTGHSWLETVDGVVIDITGDQFKGKRHRFNYPVYVGNWENGFHDQFVQIEKESYQPYDFDYLDPNVRTYSAIMRFLNQQ